MRRWVRRTWLVFREDMKLYDGMLREQLLAAGAAGRLYEDYLGHAILMGVRTAEALPACNGEIIEVRRPGVQIGPEVFIGGVFTSSTARTRPRCT